MENQQKPLEETKNFLKTFNRVPCSDSKSQIICSVIFNFIVWLFIILIIIVNTTEKEDNSELNKENYGFTILFSVFGSFSYIFYILIELCCSTTLTLIRTKDNATIKEKICDF